jgi:hypothetical protein
MNEPTGSGKRCFSHKITYLCQFFLGGVLMKSSSVCWCSLLPQLVSNLAQEPVVFHDRCRLLHVSQTSLHPFLLVLTKGPQPIPKRIFHRVTSNASSFSFQYLVVSFSSSSRRLRLLPRFLFTLI